jgi:glycosyltransferase involved in cell wall biosynthesis
VIDHVGIVIPARDEADLIGRCLASVVASAAEARARAGVSVTIVVIADECSDDTAVIARSFDGVIVHETSGANVGIARATGARIALDSGCSWIACTDADSAVPPNWVAHQLRLAAAGCDVVVGTVRPDFADLAAEHVAQWKATHVPGEPNGHVHGANLGVRASSYLSVGGFGAMPEHEDNDLVSRLTVAGAVIVASDEAEVMTSGRLVGRTAGGYAGHLRRIADELAAAPRAVSA